MNACTNQTADCGDCKAHVMMHKPKCWSNPNYFQNGNSSNGTPENPTILGSGTAGIHATWRSAAKETGFAPGAEQGWTQYQGETLAKTRAVTPERDRGEIEPLLGEVHGELERLEKELRNLEAALGPVLSPSCPIENQIPGPCNSTVGGVLADFVARIRNLQAFTLDIYRRSQV